jgi:hypothetical protein
MKRKADWEKSRDKAVRDWKSWVRQLKKYLTHETPVMVENDKGDLIPAKIMQVDFRTWQILVRFDSDTVTKPGYKKVPNVMGGFGSYDMEPAPEYVDVWDEKVPVKEMWVNHEYLKFLTK